jgi:hypothetical protein
MNFLQMKMSNSNSNSNGGSSGSNGRDIFRDTPLRYAAFANDFGEVLRSSIGNRLANASYAITIAYALGDVANTYRKHLPVSKEKAMAEMKDCAIWQTFASVLVTPVILGLSCRGLTRVASKLNIPAMLKHRGPEVICLGSIPFIVPPIDQMTDDMMDKYYREVPKHRKH